MVSFPKSNYEDDCVTNESEPFCQQYAENEPQTETVSESHKVYDGSASVSDECRYEELETFFRSISYTMRSFPPLEIARMKLLIYNAVGAQEVLLLQKKNGEKLLNKTECLERFENEGQNESFEESLDLDGLVHTGTDGVEFVNFPSGIHRILKHD